MLEIMHVRFVLNHTHNVTVGDVLMNADAGSTCDIIPLLCFTFYQPACFMHDDQVFLSESAKDRGRFDGIS